MRALLFLYACIQLGYLTKKRMDKMAAAVRATSSGSNSTPAASGNKSETDLAGVAKTTMQQGDKELNAVRAASENQLHLAALFYSDRLNYHKQVMIVTVLDGLAKWHSDQNATLRSAEDTPARRGAEVRAEVHADTSVVVLGL